MNAPELQTKYKKTELTDDFSITLYYQLYLEKFIDPDTIQAYVDELNPLEAAISIALGVADYRESTKEDSEDIVPRTFTEWLAAWDTARNQTAGLKTAG